MISHVVLMKPKPNLSKELRAAFVESFERAVRDIPAVQAVRIGRRVTFGASYESLAPDAADYLAVIDFDDLAALQAYLQHPAHAELGKLFYRALDSGMACDFEVGGLEMLAKI